MDLKRELRKATKEDLKDFKYEPQAECDVCHLKHVVNKGAYRGSDYYICEAHFLEGVFFEVEDESK